MANASKQFRFAPSETAAVIELALDTYMLAGPKTVVAVTHHSVRGMQVYTVFTS